MTNIDGTANVRRGTDHEHDYRARYVAAPSVYHAICRICNDNAGVVNMTGFETISGLRGRLPDTDVVGDDVTIIPMGKMKK